MDSQVIPRVANSEAHERMCYQMLILIKHVFDFVGDVLKEFALAI